MIFKETEIGGAYIIEPEKFEDERGFFARGFCEKEFDEHGIEFKPVQANIGYNNKKNTLRGMHIQVGPHAESKLVRCTKGSLFDVILDLRKDSPTYKKWTGAELTAENRRMLYLPAGCAHGYQTLVDDTEVFYMVSAFYAPGFEKGVRWNDPLFNIQWKEHSDLIISEKDMMWADYTEQTDFHHA